jgi:peptidase E
MKLILASQGFTTDEMKIEVAKIVGKPANEINIAIINETACELAGEKSKRWLIHELSNIEKHIGGRIDFVNFRTHSKEEIRTRLMNADLTYIVGGKQHIYSKLFHETNTVDLIQEVAEKRVLMGTSAGSIVLGKQITSPRFWAERYNTKVENFEYQELELVPFNIVPHFLRKDHEKWTLEFLKDVLADNPFTVYAITDNQAVAYIDGKISFIGGNPEILGQN